MISGYRNTIYDLAFRNWQRIDFKTMTRGGHKNESIWINYTPPAIPAELTFLGNNFRERERIKRKKIRWAKKLAKLPLAEQKAILEILLGTVPPEVAVLDKNNDTAKDHIVINNGRRRPVSSNIAVGTMASSN